MTTNLRIDDRLLVEAQRIGHNATKRETVEQALREYVARRKQSAILRVAGRVSWNSKHDYKAARTRERR